MARVPDPNFNPRLARLNQSAEGKVKQQKRQERIGQGQQNQQRNIIVDNYEIPPEISSLPRGQGNEPPSYRLQESLHVPDKEDRLVESLKQGSKITRVTPLKNKKYGLQIESFDRHGDVLHLYADVSPETYQAIERLSEGGIDPQAFQAPSQKKGFVESFKLGYEWQGQRPKEGPGIFSDKNSSRYARSLIVDTLRNRHPPKAFYTDINKWGANLGRLAGDITGFGTQHYAWNVHPLDMLSTGSYNAIQKAGGTPALGRVTAWAAAGALGAASGSWNPLNFSEGGRNKGFRAISTDEEDYTKSTNPVMDTFFHRGILGRTGWLLPWEQFTQERPDVSYEQYQEYSDYLRDSGVLGVLKGTASGIDGPEFRLMGYRVTPLGAAAAGTIVAGGLALAKHHHNKMLTTNRTPPLFRPR